MSQETELDDLDLDKLLDDEDFLEDFDFEEPVVDSGLQAGGRDAFGGWSFRDRCSSGS